MATYTCPVCGEAIPDDTMRSCPGCSWDLSHDIHFARFLGEPGEALKAAQEERLRHAKAAWDSRIAIEGLKAQVSGILQKLEERDSAWKETMRRQGEEAAALRTMLEALIQKTRSFDFEGVEAKQAAMQGQIAKLEVSDAELRSGIEGAKAQNKHISSMIEGFAEQHRRVVEATGAMNERISSLQERMDALEAGTRGPVRVEAAGTAFVEMVPVEGGGFLMGSNLRDPGERPEHRVTLSSFLLGKYPVTQGQYRAVMGENPSKGNGVEADLCPVEMVTWYDAVEFCNRLSEREGLQPVYRRTERRPATGYPIQSALVEMDPTRNGYRLPTEAEWEYAAQGGKRSKVFGFSGSNDPDAVGWYSGNSQNTSHPVGRKAANELGLYDMTGNVWEWCWDRFGPYLAQSQNNPVGLATGSERVSRGGCWGSTAENCRITFRNHSNPGGRISVIGFRIVRRG